MQKAAVLTEALPYIQDFCGATVLVKVADPAKIPAGAAACDAQAETNQGFTNYLAALGIVETVAIFAMVFALIALGSVK